MFKVTIAWACLATASTGFAQYEGCKLYSCIDFPGETWPAVPVPATSVAIGNPTGIAVDADGKLYIAGPSIIFKLEHGMLTRIAGNGHNGYAGDGGAAAEALVGFPRAFPNDLVDFWDITAGLATDRSGNLYVADFFNNRVRKIGPDGIITSVAGEAFRNPFGWPAGVTQSPAGDLYVTGSFDNLWKVGAEGAVPVIGNNCGRPHSLGLCGPYGAAADGDSNVYVADTINCRIVKRSPEGAVSVIAGNDRPSAAFLLTCGYSGDGGRAVEAALNGPYGIAADDVGNLYVADTYNNRIRRISPDSTISTVSGSAAGFSGDGGPASDALLNHPHGIAVDAVGNIYIADTENFRVRKITPDGIISTVAGNGLWSAENPQGLVSK